VLLQSHYSETTGGGRVASKAHHVTPYPDLVICELFQVPSKLEYGLLRNTWRMAHEHVPLVAIMMILHRASQLLALLLRRP
jgi:hypothetical protein